MFYEVTESIIVDLVIFKFKQIESLKIGYLHVLLSRKKVFLASFYDSYQK